MKTATAPLTRGRLAAAAGCKAETIRFYEKIGLLPAPRRTASNYRTYAPEQVARLRFIRRARDLGFSVEEVRALLELADERERECSEVDALAQKHLIEVERKIADLQSLAGELRDIIGQCRGGTIAECRIIDALAPRSPSA